MSGQDIRAELDYEGRPNVYPAKPASDLGYRAVQDALRDQAARDRATASLELRIMCQPGGSEFLARVARIGRGVSA